MYTRNLEFLQDYLSDEDKERVRLAAKLIRELEQERVQLKRPHPISEEGPIVYADKIDV